MAFSLNNPHWLQLADEHRQWLMGFEPLYRVQWDKMLANDDEAAMCEAGVRRKIQELGLSIRPNENLSDGSGGPDFHCSDGVNNFYVEATCISVETAERKSEIKDEPTSGVASFKIMGMVEAVFSKCGDKAPQCANLDSPALVAVGTFHLAAAIWGFNKILVGMMLTGKTSLAWNITASGEQAGDAYQITSFEKAAFLRRDDIEEVDFKRSSISGLLMIEIGTGLCLGVLHPNPVRPFDPTVLPAVEFGQVQLDKSMRQLHVHWTGGITG